MRDPLKEYVDQHRAELDVAVPSEKLWTNIETAMITAVPAAGITSGISWLKYFAFGLSSVAGAAIIYSVISGSPSASEEISAPLVAGPVQTIEVSETPVSSIATPAATEFILINTAAPLPPPPPEELSFVPVISEPVSEDTVQQPAEIVMPLATVAPGDSVFTGIRRVEIVASSATIVVKGTDGNAVSTGLKEVENVITDVDYKRTDTLLQITLKNKCTKQINGPGKNFVIMSGASADPVLSVNVPSGTSVVVRNSHGETEVSNITAPVCEVHSSSGDIHLASINALTSVVSAHGDLDVRAVTGNLTARLSSGNLVASAITGNVDVISAHGDQKFTDITGNLHAVGASGEIHVTDLLGDINAKTTHGDIHLTGFKGSAHLVSSSGSVIGNKIELTGNSTFITTHGDVKMTLLNPLETLSFELNTTHGEILVDKNGEQFREESKLTLTRGSILVKATSSSGDQVFR
jgi:DUF4097 and DUF4098 domain-containing protein YvlB